ncbi:MAG: ATP-binding protein [Anaerolineaceae bacterium]
MKEKINTLNAIRLLSQLNDQKFSVEGYENRFLQGLISVFANEYAILLRMDDKRGSQGKRKLCIGDQAEFISSEVKFNSGLLFESSEKRKTIQFEPGKDWVVNPIIDAPAGAIVFSLVSVPLIFQNQLLGVLAIGNSPAFPLKKNGMDILMLLSNSLASHLHSEKTITELEESNAVLKTSQQQLINSRNTLRTLFDNTPESFYIVDEKYTLIAVNFSRSGRAGMPPQRLVGGKCFEVLFHLNSPCPGCLVAQTLKTDLTQIRRVHYLQKDRTNLEWEIHTYPVPEAEGKLRQVILLEQNITEKRKLEAELIQSEKLAAVGQLAAGIAHDINNPLTSIIANAQILIADLPEDQPDLLQCAQLIELAGTKATQVVRNLLTSARKEEFVFAPIDINENIQSALLLLSHEFISRDINITFNRGYEMPCISASDNHLQSVWTNLIMNSIEAIGEKPGKIEITSQFDGKNFIVNVQDNGAGIPKEYVGQIFEPFFTTKKTEDGTGLGLTSVRRIVQAHNGRIMVESEEGLGSTFTVVLPKEQKAN